VPYEPSRWSEVHVGRWLAMAAGLLIVAGGVYAVSHMRITRDNTTAAAAQRDSVLSSEVAALRAEVERRDSVIGALTGMHTRVIDLVSNQSAEPMARMFWDQQTQQWTMYASHIKPPAPGKTYQLWLIARGRPQPISGGTFNPDQNGSAVMTARMALEPGALRRIAVTEEPDGGMPAPTGPIMFAGQ
jgi:anti-sigma-K factor RskA